MKYKIIEHRGEGIEYTEVSGLTLQECQDELLKIENNYYGDLDDRCNGNGAPFIYTIEEDI